MKHFAIAFLLLASTFAVQAQSVPASLKVDWVAPTTTTPPESLPLTGSLALTEYQMVVSSDPIAANFSGIPTYVIAAPSLTMTQPLTVANHSTLHVRMRACHKPTGALECSAWTDEATKPVEVATTPNPPTSIVIDLRINL